jgi:hypothetical protein
MIVILAKIELSASDPMAYPPDYVEKLTDPKNWNDPAVDSEIYDDLRTALVEVMSLEDIEIVSVKKV